MLTTCPKCRQPYVGKMCPRCQPGRPTQRQAVPWDNPLTPGHWSQSPWIRCAVGIAVSQGLFLGIRRWSEAAVTFFGPADLQLTWTGYTGFLAWGGLQGTTVFLGSMLVGAGQRDWLFYGLTVGFINTVIGLALSGGRFLDISPLMIVALMLGSFLAGVVGCRVGAFIWKPLDPPKPSIELGVSGKQGAGIAVKDLFAQMNFLTFKVNWLRILIGATLGILGPAFAPEIFYYAVNSFGLRGALEQSLEVRTGMFIILVRTFSVFFAGFIAGSNSTTGTGHGFWCGLLVAAGMAVAAYIRSLTPQGEAFSPEDVLAYAFMYLGLCMIGGYFGSRMLPPVIHTGKRKLTKVAEI